MKLRLAFAVFVCACLALLPSLAHAQMSDGEKKAAARAAYTEGVELQDKGKPADALVRFEAAQKLFDAPTHVLRIAQCQTLTGKLVEASETYETLIRKTLPPGSPDAFVQAQEQGKTELSALRQRIPTMRVTMKPDPQTLHDVHITVNDKQMPNELLGIARPVNPGPYKITATATGWATPTLATVEMQEKDQKSVELALQKGAAVPVAVVGPTSPNGAVPPPYDQATPATTAGASAAKASTTGLLLGARGGVFVPGGDVDRTTKFENYATAGPGFGIDAIGRLAKLFLIGGTFEFASLGAPDAKVFKSGTTAEIGTLSTYFGLLIGVMPNVDRVTFVGDIGAGFRGISRTVTLTDTLLSPATPKKSNERYSGFELGVNAGLSFPAGPLRIVPKVGIAFGKFTGRDCGDGAAASPANPGCASGVSPVVSTAGHTMFNVVLGIYYHLDLSKKSGAASGSRFFTTASN